MYRVVFASALLLGVMGCSSLGISLSPSQNTLTDQAKSLIDRSPNPADLPRELDMNVLAAHFLQPGDVLLVEPVALGSEVQFPADQKVLADGTLDLGKVGRVIVVGLTLEQAESHIEATIVAAGEKSMQVNVRLLEPVHRIYVLGEVASPGTYPFTGNETVLDGILAAGGLTTQANACKVVLARPTSPPSCRVALPICYREITQLGDTSTNYQLQPGDRIFVASRSLCDDLQFWNANKTCDRCCKCQFPCPDPTVAAFANPISPNLPAAPIPPTYKPKTDEAEAAPFGNESEVTDDRVKDADLPVPSFRSMLRTAPPTQRPTSPTPQGQLNGQLNFDPPL